MIAGLDESGLYYEIHGHPDAPPLILSSGLGGSAEYWAPNIPALAARFRVIAYDHRGTGRSDRTACATLTVEDMARDVAGLMDLIGIAHAHFVGHALGGMIGMALALAAPERVDRLVVVNGWGRIEAHTVRCFEARLALLRNAGELAYIKAQPIFLYPANWLTRDAPAGLLDDAEQLTHFPGAAAIEQRIAAARAFDVLDRIVEINAPLLAYCSGDDVLVPSMASTRIVDRLAPGNGGAELIRRWGGHACNVTDAEAFNRIVPGWLADGHLLQE